MKYQLKENPELEAKIRAESAAEAYLEAERVYYDKTVSKEYRDQVNNFDLKLNGKNAFLQKKKREDILDSVKLSICLGVVILVVLWACNS